MSPIARVRRLRSTMRGLALATCAMACAPPATPPPPVDPLVGLDMVSTHAAARSFALFDGARVAVAREHVSDVLFADITPGAAALDEAVDVGVGPRSIASCTRGDERLIFTADTTGSSVTVLSDAGGGAFGVLTTLERPGIPRTVACLDAPGGADVVVVVAEGVGADDGHVVVLTIAPDGTATELASHADPGVALATPLAAVGDGAIEIAAVETRNGTVSTFVSGGADGPSRTYSPCADPSSAALADLDGVAPLDLAIACHDGTVAVITDRTLAAPAVRRITVGGDFYDLVATDLDADGAADLAVTDEANHRVVVLMGLGGGAFSEASSHPVARGPLALHAGDLDADGDPDLVVLSYEEPAIGWLLNSTRP